MASETTAGQIGSEDNFRAGDGVLRRQWWQETNDLRVCFLQVADNSSVWEGWPGYDRKKYKALRERGFSRLSYLSKNPCRLCRFKGISFPCINSWTDPGAFSFSKAHCRRIARAVLEGITTSIRRRPAFFAVLGTIVVFSTVLIKDNIAEARRPQGIWEIG
jgi:hypothetical protein